MKSRDHSRTIWVYGMTLWIGTRPTTGGAAITERHVDGNPVQQFMSKDLSSVLCRLRQDLPCPHLPSDDCRLSHVKKSLKVCTEQRGWIAGPTQLPSSALAPIVEPAELLETPRAHHRAQGLPTECWDAVQWAPSAHSWGTQNLHSLCPLWEVPETQLFNTPFLFFLRQYNPC